jgi:hypothetical protein
MLDARNRQCVASAEGRQYELEATRTFWGDASFMQECVPPGTPAPGPLTIYIQVRPDGSMGSVVITPDTPLAACIKKATVNRRFSPPPGECVVKVSLNFTQ